MRRACYIAFLIPIFVLVIVVLRILAFVQLFFEHSGIGITQKEIRDADIIEDVSDREQVVPKIIHQVFHDWRNESSMPADWREVRQSCISKNPDWEHKLWTLDTSRNFIEKEYFWFLDTYDGYKFPVQRVDTVRYFLLLHYGGIYLDLDNGCLASLDPLLYYPAWTTDGGRGALSNNILGATPNHPFWELMTQSLIPYDWNWFFPYITISYASGQWFETAVWEKYHKMLPQKQQKQDRNLHRIMMDDRPGTEPWIFFSHKRGGSWVNWDNHMFLWIGDHLILLVLGAFGLLAISWWGVGRLVSRVCGHGGRTRAGMAKMDVVARHKRHDEEVDIYDLIV